jgi:hypothetical protein
MLIISRAVARINISGLESFETRTRQLFLCKRQDLIATSKMIKKIHLHD